MYIRQDYVTPSIERRLSNVRARSQVLRWWPTRIVDGVEIMSTLPYYAYGVIADYEALNKMLTLFGLEKADLAGDYTGVDSAYFYIKAIYEEEATLLEQDLHEYFNTLQYGIWLDPPEILQVFSTTALTDAEVLEQVKDYRQVKYGYNNNSSTALALIDYSLGTNVFSHTLEVIGLGLTNEGLDSRLSSVVGEYNYNVSYSYKLNAPLDGDDTIYLPTKYSDEVISYTLSAVNNEEPDIDEFTASTSLVTFSGGSIYTRNTTISVADLLRADLTSVGRQLIDVYNNINPFNESDIYIKDDLTGEMYVKKEGIENMPANYFAAWFASAVSTGYIQTNTSTWVRIVTGLVLAVLMTVAVLSGQIWVSDKVLLLAAAYGTAGSISLYFSVVALTLTIEQLALSSVYKFIGGSRNFTYIINGTLEILGAMSRAIGFFQMVVGVFSFVSNVVNKFTTSVSETASGFLDDTVDGFLTEVKTFTNQSTSTIITKTTKFMNSLFNAYNKYIMQPKNEAEIKAKARQLQATQEELEDLTSNKLIKAQQELFESPYENIYDMNAQMAAVPYNMTEGLIENSLTKYYD